MKTAEVLLENELESLRDAFFILFDENRNLTNYGTQINREYVYVWLFRYNKAADTLKHWKIFPNTNDVLTGSDYDLLLQSSSISGGEGTIGYVLKSGNIELINNTFLDPRGAVSFEDEIIKNYSWAGIPVYLLSDSENIEVECVVSFFYQKYDFFNFDSEEKKDQIIEKLEEIIQKHKEKILLFKQIDELEDLNGIILMPREARTFTEVLNELNKALSVNSKYSYTGILSTTKDNTFRLDQILFNTNIIENLIKDTINFCSVSDKKCIYDCIETQIHDVAGFRELPYIKGNTQCEVWQNYFYYLQPTYIFPIKLGKGFLIIYYFNSPLNLEEQSAIERLTLTFFDLFIEPIANQIFELEVLDEIIEDKRIKIIKRCTETIVLLIQLLINALYNNVLDKQFQTVILNYINTLNFSFSEFSDRKIEISEKSYRVLETIFKVDLFKILFTRNIVATEFWESSYKTIKICRINESCRMNEMKNEIRGIHNHSSLNVIKRAIHEELKEEGKGKTIIDNYNTTLLKSNETKSLNITGKSKGILKIDRDVIEWRIDESDKLDYLHSLTINENNFSDRVFNNIKSENLQIKSYDNIFKRPNFFINAKGNYFLFPTLEKHKELLKKLGQKIIIVGTDLIDRPSLDTLGNYAENLHNRMEIFELEVEKNKQALKSGIISILVDSYAHNISAHSLSALKWWFELRTKILGKRIFVGNNSVELVNLQPINVNIERRIKPDIDNTQGLKDDEIFEIKDEEGSKVGDPLMNTTRRYYETLGLSDSTYNAKFFSLFDYLQFIDNSDTNNLFRFSGKVYSSDKKDKQFNPRFPVPIDYALFPFFRFLRDKGAFWSGVTRDMAFGGESKTWYRILWEDFANNPLYLGTIAKSEGIGIINIHLAIKKGKKWIKGRFVTIDMSIIDYETEMANSDELSVKSSFDLESDKSEHLKEKGCIYDYGIEDIEFSRYAFVRPGGCFKSFREILDTPEYTAFMPGGVVGEHALFTIFENTLRNIKHYKASLYSIKKDGIDFWISIEEEKLVTNNSKFQIPNPNLFQEKGTKKEQKDKEYPLFKVSTWLAHETEIFDSFSLSSYKGYKGEENIFVENSNIFNDLDKLAHKFLLKKVTDSAFSSILDSETGAPRMGGNSQDKACAAMLFNNEFKSVERETMDRDKYYFPWIKYSHSSPNEMMDDIEFEFGYRTVESRKKVLCAYINKLIRENINSKGYLKKSFKVWRGEDYFVVNSKNDLEAENVSRFKIVVIDVMDPEENTRIKDALSESGVIRILELTEIIDEGITKELISNQIEEEHRGKPYLKTLVEIDRRYFLELYRVWLKKFQNFDSDLTVCLSEPSTKLCYIKVGKLVSIEAKRGIIEQGFNILLRLSHGGIEESSSCNVRSHGYFWNYFFSHIPDKELKDLQTMAGYFPPEKTHLLYEFIETITTRIMIFDNRIFSKFEKLEKEKVKVFNNYLQLVVSDENFEDVKFHEDIQRKANNYSEKTTVAYPNVLVLHLSLIESIERNGIKYNEDTIYEFIQEELDDFFVLDSNFILVIITGRGRDKWRKTLKIKDLKKAYINRTYFKPVESLLNAVESGLSYNDNFDVKYNLCKVLFGS